MTRRTPLSLPLDPKYISHLLLYSLVQNDTLQRTLAHRAEPLSSVVTHTAYIRRTIDTLSTVTTTLISTDSVVLASLVSNLRRHLNTLGNHIGPLRCEIYEGCDVWLPRLVSQRVHIVIIVAIIIEILVAKTTERVAELVDNNRLERWVMSRCEGI